MTSGLVEKKNTKSPVWRYFAFEADTDGKPKDIDKPKCKLCQEDITARFGNTSNLYTHIRNKHPSIYTSLAKERQESSSSTRCNSSSQTSVTALFEKSRKFDRNSREHKELTRSVTTCLAKDMLPLSTVDKPGFRAMISKFNPRYDLPTRSYFSRIAIPALYQEVREGLQSSLRSVDIDHFSGTTDLWSSSAMEPYLSYTIHYVTSSWELTSHCLQAHYMPEDHTGMNLQDALSQTLLNWELDATKLVALTTDSGSNIVLACDLLHWRRLSCFGHNLDLAIQKGIADGRVERVLRVCRQIVSSFSYSWKRRRELAEEQDKRNLPKHKLKADVKTRWGSVFDMISRIMEQQEPIRIILANDRRTAHLVPTWQDMDVLESVVAVLSPLREFTDLLAGEKKVTVSAILPLLRHIQDSILANTPGESNLTKEIKARIKSDLQSRYSEEITLFLRVCTFLDPRFKLTQESNTSIIEAIKQTVKDEMEQVGQSTTSPTPSTQEEGSIEPPSKTYKTAWGKIFGDKLSQASASLESLPQRVEKEFEQYLHYPLQDIESSPLQWWKLQHQQFPLLAKMARKYLCVCATSVPSERLFSTGGKIVNGRSRLKPDKVNELIFLAENLTI